MQTKYNVKTAKAGFCKVAAYSNVKPVKIGLCQVHIQCKKRNRKFYKALATHNKKAENDSAMYNK